MYACHCGRQKHVRISDTSTCSQSFPDGSVIQLARYGYRSKRGALHERRSQRATLRNRLHTWPWVGGGHTELLGELVGRLGPVRERVIHADLLQAVQDLRSAERTQRRAGLKCG